MRCGVDGSAQITLRILIGNELSPNVGFSLVTVCIKWSGAVSSGNVYYPHHLVYLLQSTNRAIYQQHDTLDAYHHLDRPGLNQHHKLRPQTHSASMVI